MNDEFEYDVFLSHSSQDKPAVLKLAERLKADGLRVWLDEWVIAPGDMIGLGVEKGLQRSRTLILFMSAAAFASEWVTLERHTALFRDPTNQHRRFIPLRIDNAPINDMLRQFAYVDWRTADESQYAKLLAACCEKAAPSETVAETAPSPSSPRVLNDGGFVWDCAVTPDGRRVVSALDDWTLSVWDLESGQRLRKLKGHKSSVWGCAVTPDGRAVVSASVDHTLRVWDLESGQEIGTLEGHTDVVRGCAVTADGRRVVSASFDHTLRVWDLESGRELRKLEGHTDSVMDCAVTPDSRRVISASSDKTLRVWDLESGREIGMLEGHTDGVVDCALTADRRRVVSASNDNTLRVSDLESGQELRKLEGHADDVLGCAVTPDSRCVISASSDKTLRVWDLELGREIGKLEGHTDGVRDCAVTPDGRRVVSASTDYTLRVWDLEPAGAAGYTNAKVLLVGDSGVGKTGLAIRLTENKFQPTVSTDAHWATQMPLAHDADTDTMEREIWLWDFAGQSDYRLIHQLFMDETALAVLVFNPQDENPFEGLGQWDHDLARAARGDYHKLLVAGRCDRGGLMVSRESMDRFARERGFDEWMETSAKTGGGCDGLRDAIIDRIDWSAIAWTVSPRIFKVLKAAIVELKDEAKDDEALVLMRVGELKQQLDMRLPEESFSIDELRTVVGLLGGPGIVWKLEFGDFVLLQPERINAYAAAVVRSVRSHKDQIGCIDEQRVLSGDLKYEDMQRLRRTDEEVVLRAMHQTFVDHGLCLRERTEKGMQLVFPSYYRRERPELEGEPAVIVTYQFKGTLNAVYATLVVRLHHTTTFESAQLWRWAADFKTPAGKRIGLKMSRGVEGAGQIAVYCEPGIPEDTQVTFIQYVHEHLKAKDPDVVRVRHYVCGNVKCGEPVESVRAIKNALEKKAKTIPCQFCGKRITLRDLIEAKFDTAPVREQVREMNDEVQAIIDNESRELILIGHAFATAGEAGQIFRPTANSDWGLDGEIEFKEYDGNASGQRVYLQLKSGDSYLQKRKRDGAEVFQIKNPRHAEYWQQHKYPVMLVIRTSDGEIRWMDVGEYLKKKSKGRKTPVKQIVFDGEPFTALNLQRMRDKVIPLPG
jgi:small GTP-binding protein